MFSLQEDAMGIKKSIGFAKLLWEYRGINGVQETDL